MTAPNFPSYLPSRLGIRMQTRFMLYFGAVVITLMTAVMLLMEQRQATTMLRQTEMRGVAVANSIASVVRQSLYEYDYVYLQQAAETAAQDEGVAYVVILDKEGAVAGHSGRSELVGQAPEDPLSVTVHDSQENRIEQFQSYPPLRMSEPFLDIAVPVRSENSDVKWGTIRVGISLHSVTAELIKTRWLLVVLGFMAVAVVLVSARFFSRQITQPMEGLARATAAVASGDLDHAVREDLLGELGDLARSFNKMTNDLKRSRDAVRYQNQHLENMVQERTAALREKARELERANTELKELDRLKSDFLSNVSHELRTPLTSIRSFTEILLEQSVGLNEMQQREFLEIVANQADRLTRLISDLLDLSKIEAGEFHCQLESMYLDDVVRPCLTTLQTLAAEKNVELVAQIEKDIPPILADFDRLSQVLTNLVDNAIKFTDEGGTIEVSARIDTNRRGRPQAPTQFAGMETDTPETGEYVIVSVKDSGLGIAPDDQQRIFEKFGQVGNVLTDKPQGTGLGLTICGTIIVHHGGALWVESTEGEGSEFFFSVPVAGPDNVSAETLDTAESAERIRHDLSMALRRSALGRRILVVDDEPILVSAIERYLEPLGFTAVCVYDGVSALEKARQLNPDAILLDIMMPDLNGYDVLKALKEDAATAEIPVIVLSGLDDAETAFELGASDFIKKPYDMVSILNDVRALA